MWKKPWFPVLLLFLIGLLALLLYKWHASSGHKVHIILNNREIGQTQVKGRETPALPLDVLDDLGYQVDWDRKQGSLTLIKTKIPAQELRLQLLEAALRPDTPQDAVRTWAKGVKERNGALQYAVLAPELRRQELANLQASNWVTGCSSPWVDSFDVVPRGKTSSGRLVYEVLFHMMTSTGPAGSEASRIEVAKIADEYGAGPCWLITSIYRFTQNRIPGSDLIIPLPQDWRLSGEENNIFSTVSNRVIGRIDHLGGPYLPNHSEMLVEKQVNTPLGPGKIYLIRMSTPAAAGKPETWEEVHALIPYDKSKRDYYDIWVRLVPKEQVGQVISTLETAARGIVRSK